MEDIETTAGYKLGQMDARIGNIETSVANIQADVKVLLARDAQQSGSKTTMASVGAGGVGVGGLLLAAIQLFTGDHHQTQQQTQPAIVQPAPQYQQPSDRRVNPAEPY